MTLSCTVCCSDVKKLVKCSSCEYEACKYCIRIYVLQKDSLSCMNCKKEWTEDFCIGNLGKRFMQDKYSEYLFEIEWKKEMSRLPESQTIIDTEQKIQVLRKKQSELYKEISTIQEQIQELKTNKPKQTRYICKCPNCNGFISSSYKCGVCEIKICKDCREIKDKNHQCNSETVETIKLLKDDSKPCPKCAIPIFKIDGCDQMFCTSCKTTFSWKTNKIETKIFHNPHYYAWMRKRVDDGELKEVPRNDCNNIPQLPAISFKNKTITEIYRHAMAFNDVKEDIKDNGDLRMDFLKNEITEEKFKTILRSRIKKDKKIIEYNQVTQTFVLAVFDIVRNLNRKISLAKTNEMKHKLLQIAESELLTIMKYTNKQIQIVRDKYNSKAYLLLKKILLDDPNYYIDNLISIKGLSASKINKLRNYIVKLRDQKYSIDQIKIELSKK